MKGKKAEPFLTPPFLGCGRDTISDNTNTIKKINLRIYISVGRL
ncbi:MAG: hypothetical protein ACMUJM_24290 [bacterium]